MFDVLRVVATYDHVLVRDNANRVGGIVTATDLSQQFRALSEPFLLLSEIENHIRNMIGGRFTVEELRGACDPADGRTVNAVADLSFGEYLRLLEKPENWERLSLRIDRVYFCKKLDFVRAIRNEVMHFDPDGIDPDQLKELGDFSLALRLLLAH